MERTLLKELLQEIDQNESVNSLDYSGKMKQPHQIIVGAIKSIEHLGNIIDVEQVTKKSWELTEEGIKVCKEGSLEARLYNFVPVEGIDIAEIKSSIIFQSNSSIAIGQALKQKWIRKEQNMIKRNMDSIIDKTKDDLVSIRNGETLSDKITNDYKKRQLIVLAPLTIFIVTKGPEFTVCIKKQETELTREMIESGSWKTASFKPFNFEAKGKVEHRSGYLHPLMQLRAEFRKVFMQMGFTEMPTAKFVESAFWNFDALFQPQKHPARDAQDTFYISNPETSSTFPMDYLERVKKVHSTGDYGSTGYRSPWSFDETKKNLLRTHTTAASARLLHNIAKEGFRPIKYFSIDKVYRNETLDATHLAEFYQVEGVMGDYNLSMKDLMGTLNVFFKKIGITDIRFKPTYNPYTEPSMEMYSYHKGLQKWVEVGNSGLFRPEMLRTMGLPEDARIAGFGLALERNAMIMFEMNNIRELVGSKVKMELIFDNAVCTLDKYGRKSRANTSLGTVLAWQESLLEKLKCLDSKLSKSSDNTLSKTTCCLPGNVKGFNMTIQADPSSPPRSIFALLSVLKSIANVSIAHHKHSSCGEFLLPDWNDSELFVQRNSNTGVPDCSLRILWRKRESGAFSTEAMVSSRKIHGEPNVCRFLARCIEASNSNIHLYEKFELSTVGKIDKYLEYFPSMTTKDSDFRPLLESIERSLCKCKYLCGDLISIADYIVLSQLQNSGLIDGTKIKKWVATCQEDHNAQYIFA